MFGWFKRKKKELGIPPPPKSGQAAYVEWVTKYHPAYQKPAQKDEVGGPTGPEPTRYGTWERGGVDVDF